MTHDEVITLVRQVALSEGWPWLDPIMATKRRQFFIAGPITWHVMSNAESRGMNVSIHIDDQSGNVTAKGYCPR